MSVDEGRRRTRRQRPAAAGRADDHREPAGQRGASPATSSHRSPREHELVISHGNGPQIGLLALQEAAYEEVPDYPLDVLGAETQGMIGYLVEQELGNRLPFEKPTRHAADDDRGRPRRPGLRRPDQAHRPDLHRGGGRDAGRRAGLDVPARRRRHAPRRALAARRSGSSSIRQIRWLLEHGLRRDLRRRRRHPDRVRRRTASSLGVEAVIDKDHASGLLARDVDADVFVMATDTPAVYLDFGTPEQRAIAQAHPDALLRARRRVRRGLDAAQGRAPPATSPARPASRAAIGALADIEGLVAGTAGTQHHAPTSTAS